MLTKAPEFDFTLPDHLGREFALSSRRGIGPTVVVFIRGHWCPYCRRYLQKLQKHLPLFRQSAAEVIVISPEPRDTSAQLAGELNLEFAILCDQDARVIDLFGVRNRWGDPDGKLPHASVFVLDDQGRAIFQSIDRNYKRRTTMRTILQALQSPGTK